MHISITSIVYNFLNSDSYQLINESRNTRDRSMGRDISFVPVMTNSLRFTKNTRIIRNQH